MDTLLQALQSVATSTAPTAYRLGLADVALLFFITLGPLKAIGPFAAAARGLAPEALRALALKVFLLSAGAVVVGGLVGSKLTENWHISNNVLQLTGGLIFFLAALQLVMAQYIEPPATPPAAPTLAHLVFPVSVTPYGIATVILLLALSAQTGRTLQILAIAVVMLVLNVLALFSARTILRWAGLPLQIIGAVLGVLQVALGVEIMLDALVHMGVGITLG